MVCEGVEQVVEEDVCAYFGVALTCGIGRFSCRVCGHVGGRMEDGVECGESVVRG